MPCSPQRVVPIALFVDNCRMIAWMVDELPGRAIEHVSIVGTCDVIINSDKRLVMGDEIRLQPDESCSIKSQQTSALKTRGVARVFPVIVHIHNQRQALLPQV